MRVGGPTRQRLGAPERPASGRPPARSRGATTVRRMEQGAGRRERAERILEALTASEHEELAGDIKEMEAQAERFEAVVNRGDRGQTAP